MSDDDFEELPSIFVNSSVSNASTFRMPSAEALATQRAREQECERELQLLRERHGDERCGAEPPAAPARCDSSGSEGEAALAAAVTDLRVLTPPAAPPAPDVPPALARALPPVARPLLDRPDAATRLPELVASVGALVSADEVAWSDEDGCAAGALLAAAALAPGAGPRAATLRPLHTLLDYRATDDQVEALGRMLVDALPTTQVRLKLSDAVRSGAGAGADRVAAALVDAALGALLEPAAGGAAELSTERLVRALGAGWRRLEPGAGYAAVRLLGRRLGAGREAGGAGRGPVLAALGPPLAPPHEAQRPDRLKVLVGMDTLRLLFHSES